MEWIQELSSILMSFHIFYSPLFTFQKKLQDVSMKFRLFQKPANFEQRLQECKRILDEVKLQVPKLETKSVEQEVVQSHLDHCMVNT